MDKKYITTEDYTFVEYKVYGDKIQHFIPKGTILYHGIKYDGKGERLFTEPAGKGGIHVLSTWQKAFNRICREI